MMGTSGLVRLLLVGVGSVLTGCGSRSTQRPSCLLVTLDTTRPDALGSYASVSTPNLDHLAREGVVFERAYASAPLTLPSHATLLSGLYPLRHGLRDNGMGPLAPTASTLAELGRDAGLATGAFVAAVVLDAAFGLDQGFETYDAPAAAANPHGERPAAEVIDAALEWFTALPSDRPFLLWVHLYDPHSPYTPPPRFAGADRRSNYQGEVAYADHELGRLLEALREDPRWVDTLVVVAGDHGEAFGEHGEEGHSVHVWDTTIRVPLLLRPPPARQTRFTPGTRSREVVGLVDLLPTIAEALGTALPAGIDGTSFWSRPVPSDHGVYFESYYGYFAFGWSPLAGWVDAEGKYVHSSEPRWYDVVADPEETDDRFEEAGSMVRRYRARIAAVAELPVLERPADAAADPALLESIRGLGYAAVGGETRGRFPHPLESTGLPSPDRMDTLYRRALEGVELGKRGDLRGAERIFREVLAVNPRNYFVLDHLATSLFRQGRPAEAAETLRRIVEWSPMQPAEPWYKLGVAEQAAGHPEAALEAYERALELGPASRKYLEAATALLRERGENRKALELLRRYGRPDLR